MWLEERVHEGEEQKLRSARSWQSEVTKLQRSHFSEMEEAEGLCTGRRYCQMEKV